jgi:hypothetical protein
MNLYHFVPENMVGTILYPLNMLRDTQPEVYEEYSKKYEGRELVQETEIPGLGKWNDVIHLSPIAPSEVRQALREAGSSVSSSWKVFCIDAKLLDWSGLIIHIESGPVGGKEVVNLPFTKENYAQYCHLPARTKRYYRRCVEEGKQILMYGFAPHVLYGGTIDVSRTEIRTFNE